MQFKVPLAVGFARVFSQWIGSPSEVGHAQKVEVALKRHGLNFGRWTSVFFEKPDAVGEQVRVVKYKVEA